MSERLAPWDLDELIKTWDEVWAAKLRFRVFVDKKDRKDSLRRYTQILQANRQWLNAGPSTPLESLHSECVTQLLFAGEWLAEQSDPTDALTLLGGPAVKTMGFWAFCRPDLQNLYTLFCRSTGQSLDLNDRLKQRRQEKAKLLRQFKADVEEFVRIAVYRSGSRADSNARLKSALDAARDALAIAEDQLRG
jgi:hypothetical protein